MFSGVRDQKVRGQSLPAPMLCGLVVLILVGSGLVSAGQATNPMAQPQAVNRANAAPPKLLITLRIVGSMVKNHKGETLGRLEDVVLNPDSGQIEFGMVLLNYPKNTTRTTPVPWFLLRHVSDQGQNGGVPGAQQVFQLNIERTNLVRAPMLGKAQWSLLQQPEWRHQVYAYYGFYPTVTVTVPATSSAVPGGAGEGGGPVYVEGGSSAAASSSFASIDIFGTNFVPSVVIPFMPRGIGSGTRGGSTIPSDFPPLFPGGEPVMPNAPNMFAASTNFFPGAPARLPTSQNVNIPAGTRLVPSQPGAPFSTLVPGSATPAVPLNPGSPFSVLVPAGSTPGVAANPGSAFSLIVPQNSRIGVAANPGSAWSPIVPSRANVPTQQSSPMAAWDVPAFNSGRPMQGGAPFAIPGGFHGPRGGGGPPPGSGIGLAPLAPLAPVAPTGRR